MLHYVAKLQCKIMFYLTILITSKVCWIFKLVLKYFLNELIMYQKQIKGHKLEYFQTIALKCPNPSKILFFPQKLQFL